MARPGGGGVTMMRRGEGRGDRGKGRRGHGKSPGGRREGKVQGGNSGKGLRLSYSLLKAIGATQDNPNPDSDDGSEKELAKDVYEYDEAVPEEERGTNRRFDDIDRMEYELPSDFEDEEIDEDEGSAGEENEEDIGDDELHTAHDSGRSKVTLNSESDDEGSDEGDVNGEEDEEDEERDGAGTRGKSGEIKFESSENGEGGEEDSEGEDEEEEDDERHRRLIEAVTGRSARQEREGKPRKDNVVTEAYPESEFNLNPGASSSGNDLITVEDLINPLHGATGFGTLRKRMQELQKSGTPVEAPLPKVVQDRVDRQAGYKQTSKVVSQWVPIVKRNREAPTLVFNEREELPALTTATLASTFTATTDFEKEIKSLLNKSKLVEVKDIEEVEKLQLNKLTVEEVRERQERLSKMRNLLFRHELKAKRVKKIKSKTYHRLLHKSGRDKAERDSTLSEADPEAAKAAAIKQEFLRAQERMTLKHKNRSRWAKRILKRGQKGEGDDGTRDAIADQLRVHAMLTRKIHSATLSSSDDDSSSSDEEVGDDEPTGLVLGKANSKVLAKAKVATLKALEEGEDNEVPKTGLFSIPFMARAIEKKKKAAEMEAMAVLEQLEQAEADGDILALRDDYNRLANAEKNETLHRGKMSFGDPKRHSENEKKPQKSIDELSDVDVSDDERMGRSAAGGVDMGETALGVSKRSVRTDVSCSKESDDWAINGYGLDFLANLDRRAFSTGVEPMDIPTMTVDGERTSKPKESTKCEAEPRSSDGSTNTVSEETITVHTGNESSQVVAEEVAVRQLSKRKRRKLDRSNREALTSNGSTSKGEECLAKENVAGQDGKRRKMDSSDERSNVELLPNNGTPKTDGKVEALAKEAANVHDGNRKKKSKKKKCYIAPGTGMNNGPQDTNRHHNSDERSRVELLPNNLTPTSDRKDETHAKEAANVHDGNRKTGMNSGPQDTNGDHNSGERSNVELLPNNGTPTSDRKNEALAKETSNVHDGNRKKKSKKKKCYIAPGTGTNYGPQDTNRLHNSDERSSVELSPNNGTPTSGVKDEALVKEAANVHDSNRKKKSKKKCNIGPGTGTSNGPQDTNGHHNSSLEKIVVGFAGRPSNSAATIGVLQPSEVENHGERNGQAEDNPSSKETQGDLPAAVPGAFSDDDSDQEMELPTDSMSQQALIRQAFAGDDVEAEFEQTKAQALDVEVPQGEAPVTLPGWGQWADVQKKKGQPAWIVREQEKLKESRKNALTRRKDAKLKHVIISEKMDKKASKFTTPAAPYPFKSREVYERSIRMPMGREYNTDKSFRDMIRPAVLKKAGQIIDPIKQELPSSKEQESVVREPKRKWGKK